VYSITVRTVVQRGNVLTHSVYHGAGWKHATDAELVCAMPCLASATYFFKRVTNMLHSLGMALRTCYKDVTLARHGIAHTPQRCSQSLGMVSYTRYKHVTLAGHHIARALQRCHTSWARHCTRVTNMSPSLGMASHTRYKHVTFAGNGIAHKHIVREKGHTSRARWCGRCHTQRVLHICNACAMPCTVGVTCL
jgi:hypothetical protein